MVMMPTGPVGVCLGTSPNHQTIGPQQPGQPPGVPQVGPNGPPRNEGLLMTANAPPNGAPGGYYGMDVPQGPPQQALNVVQPGGSATTSPTGGADPVNPNGNNVQPGGIMGQPQPGAGPQNGFLSQQQQAANAATQSNYSTTGQGTWTGSNTLTYTQAMQPDMQRQGNYCEYNHAIDYHLSVP